MHRFPFATQPDGLIGTGLGVQGNRYFERKLTAVGCFNPPDLFAGFPWRDPSGPDTLHLGYVPARSLNLVLT